MDDDFQDIFEPTAPSGAVTAAHVLHGPVYPPQQQLLLYSDEQWEDFVHEWAHYCLKPLYASVQRFTGAGDRGIDVAGFADADKLQGVWDNYQCKHLNHAVQPTEAWPEIGKILWHSFSKHYRAPRHYYFVAPRGVGTKFNGYLADSVKLKAGLIEHWDKHVRSAITQKTEVELEDAFRAYVEGFDFSIFGAKTSLQLIEDHRKCPCHAARFGGGLPPRPKPDAPPLEIDVLESRYVTQLLKAYSEHTKAPVPDFKALKPLTKLNNHFGRQREAFYHAESLRVFARDTVPTGTFESLQDDVYTGVVDTHDAEHPDGYVKVCEVTKAARQLQITSNPLISCSKPKDMDGICHQLANEDRLRWTKS
jgi:hypothetical protein